MEAVSLCAPGNVAHLKQSAGREFVDGNSAQLKFTAKEWEKMRLRWCGGIRNVKWRGCCSAVYGYVEFRACRVSDGDGRWRSVITNASLGNSERSTREPRLKGKLSRRAMHAVTFLLECKEQEQGRDVIEAALRRWVVSMSPKRKDWLEVLKQFENAPDRSLYFIVRDSFLLVTVILT